MLFFNELKKKHLQMCLYPKLIKNPRYKPNKKNGGKPPICLDERTEYIPTGCGNCIECRQQKARAWQVRLAEELKDAKYAYFTTLTFSNESLEKIHTTYNISEYNEIAAQAVRLFLERWRKKYKKTLRHWLITELGHTGTERIHLHGIIFNNFEITNELLNSLWQYGYSDTGKYCNLRSINYIVKYVTKIDLDHKTYKAKIFCSAGIGKRFVDNIFYKSIYKYKDHNTREYYTLENGQKVNLPIYYRNHFYDDETRQQMWRDRLDRKERYVRGIRIQHIDTDKGEKLYFNILKQAQEDNIRMGYGNRDEEWNKQNYYITMQNVNARTHVKHAHACESNQRQDVAGVVAAAQPPRPARDYNISNAELDKLIKLW